MSLGLDPARAVLEAAESEATRRQVAMNIAVCDAGGHLICFARMDDAFFGSIDVAIKKAFTAAAFRMPTDALGTICRPDREAYGLQWSNGGRLMVFGGGVPLRRGDQVVGAIGVSGGSVEEDIAVARAGADALAGSD